MVKIIKELTVPIDIIDAEQMIVGPTYCYHYLPSWREKVIKDIINHSYDLPNDETAELVKTHLDGLIDFEAMHIVD